MECEQLSLFDIMDQELCIDCKRLIKDYYFTENKTMDFCKRKKMYIDSELTIKEPLCARNKL